MLPITKKNMLVIGIVMSAHGALIGYLYSVFMDVANCGIC